MIDLAQLRREPDVVKAALGRRGVSPTEVDEVVSLDIEHRRLLQEAERLRAEVKELSRRVGEARREKDLATAEELTTRSRALGDEEREASEMTDIVAAACANCVLMIPNLPDPRVPDGADESDNVEVRRWWVGMDDGVPFPTFADHQRVPHWEIGRELGILDMESGAKLAGSMFPLYRGAGSRLIRALTFFALDRHADAYEEIRPPSVALTETMMSTGHLPKSADDMYAIERDGLWLIPTAEVPLTSLRRGEILEESDFRCGSPPSPRAFAERPARRARTLEASCACTSSTRSSSSRTARPAQADGAHADILRAPKGSCKRSVSPIACSISARGTSAPPRRTRSTSRCSVPVWTAGSRSLR